PGYRRCTGSSGPRPSPAIAGEGVPRRTTGGNPADADPQRTRTGHEGGSRRPLRRPAGAERSGNTMTWTTPSGHEPGAAASAPRSVVAWRRIGTGGLAVVLAATLFGCASADTQQEPASATGAASSSGSQNDSEGQNDS